MEAWSTSPSLACRTPAAVYHSERVCDSAVWNDGGSIEYAIGIANDGSSSSSAFDDQQRSASPACTHDGSDSRGDAVEWVTSVCQNNSVEPTSVAMKRFARKHRDNRSDVLDDTCCGRCKSNLNGKLLVRCSSCAFRRHLYCFSPPLKQHPVFHEQTKITTQGTRVRVRPSNAAIASWMCDDCRRKLCPNQSSSPSGRGGTLSISMCFASPSRSVEACKSSTVDKNPVVSVHESKLPTHTSPADHRPQSVHASGSSCSRSSESSIQIVQDKWQRGTQDTFDWYAFREEKAKVVQESRSDASSSSTELVYYSKPFVDMKRTSLSWMARVEQQKCSERQRLLRETRKRPPQKRNVMLTLTEAERQLVECALVRRQQDAVCEAELFDDTRVYQFDVSLDRIRYPQQLRPSVASLTSKTPGQLEYVVEMLSESVEAVALGGEDVDVYDATAGVLADDFKTTHRNIPATVIQSAYIRWRYKAKHLAKLRQRCDRAARQQRERSVRAQASIRLLQRCIRFLLLLARRARDAQVKKELLLTLQEATEDTKVGSSVTNLSEGAEKLAQKRIQRFFLRRVRPFIRMKKRVMSRRILRWWRRKFITHKWREIAHAVSERRREAASQTIQRTYRRFRTKRTFAVILERHALRKVKAFLRSWLIARVIKKEKMRAAIYSLATSFGAIPGDSLSSLRDAAVDTILFALGSELYSRGEFWSAAAILERAWKLNPAGASWSHKLALAYSHHMTWHMSCDAHNLVQAYEMYCVALNEFAQRSTKSELSEIDPFILQEAAIVMMQMENFGGSLRMFARLIECFPQYDGFPLWLLLAAVQLQQRGEWRQSVEYLTYLQDMAPSPYLERDILALCAIALEHQATDARARSAGKEAWSAALRQWSLAQKTQQVLQKRGNAIDLWVDPSSSNSTALATGSRSSQTRRRKWDLLNDFAQRAVSQGHYLLACRLMLYMLEIRPDERNHSGDSDSETERSERASVWWTLGDIFRHLGHLDLCVDATTRSYQCVEADDIDPAKRHEWAREAATRARSFRDDIERLSTIELLQTLFARYAQTQEA